MTASVTDFQVDMFLRAAWTCLTRHSNLLSWALFTSNHGLHPHIIQSNTSPKKVSIRVQKQMSEVKEGIRTQTAVTGFTVNVVGNNSAGARDRHVWNNPRENKSANRLPIPMQRLIQEAQVTLHQNVPNLQFVPSEISVELNFEKN